MKYVNNPKPLDNYSYGVWKYSSLRQGRKFCCEFCEYEFIVKDVVASLMSNWPGERGGNPLICIDCDERPYEMNLKIWKRLGEPRTLEEVLKEMK